MIDEERIERLLRIRPTTHAAYQPVIADLLDAPRDGQAVVGSLRWRHGSSGVARPLALILLAAAILLAAVMLVGGRPTDKLVVVDEPSRSPTTEAPGAVPNFPATAVTELLERFKTSRWAGMRNVVLDLAITRDERIWFAASGTSWFTYSTGESWPGNIVVRVGALARLYLVAIALQLVDEGRLDLGAPVSQYVSSWPAGDTITVRNLLDGSSGVASFGEPVEDLVRLVAAEPSRTWTAGDALRLARDKPPRFQPGARHEAVDTEDALLVSIIEAVTGSPVFDVLVGRVFDVGRVGHYGLNAPRVGLWDPTNSGGLVEVADLPDDVLAVLGPARGLAFPVADLARLTDGIRANPTLLSGAARATLDKPFEGGGFGGSAMCPCGGDAMDGVGLVGHTGPYTALAVYVPSERLTIALVANVAISDDDLQGLLQEIHDLVWPAIR